MNLFEYAIARTTQILMVASGKRSLSDREWQLLDEVLIPVTLRLEQRESHGD